MQHEVWARLTSPFPSEALTWIVAEVSGDGSRARLEPAWAPEAVRARLDAELGVEGWSCSMQAAGVAGVVCTLTIASVSRSAAAALRAHDPAQPAAPRPTLEAAADLAFARCARQFGVQPAVAVEHDSYWVDFDPEQSEPIYEPEPVPQAAGVPPILEGFEVRPAAPLEPAVTTGVAAEAAHEGGGRGASGEALAMIEKLIDRLKAEGLGKEAAKLVAMHHGDTAEDARELYRRLRELLRQEVSA